MEEYWFPIGLPDGNPPYIEIYIERERDYVYQK